MTNRKYNPITYIDSVSHNHTESLIRGCVGSKSLCLLHWRVYYRIGVKNSVLPLRDCVKCVLTPSKQDTLRLTCYTSWKNILDLLIVHELYTASVKRVAFLYIHFPTFFPNLSSMFLVLAIICYIETPVYYLIICIEV